MALPSRCMHVAENLTNHAAEYIINTNITISSSFEA